jgi:cytochrome c oxidase subunit 2
MFVPMSETTNDQPRRVLIASANPLFGEGLRKVYGESWGDKAVVVGVSATLDETLFALETLHPDLVIVDHDDRAINRDEFLSRFVTGEAPMQVVLVSLRKTEPVVIYNRRKLSSAQAIDWLNDPWGA